MDPFHERLARLALGVAARYGFCLAGGYAVQAHGFVERVSQDVDAAMFAEALRAVRRLPASAFEPYKLTSDEVEALTARLLVWAEEIESAAP